MSTGSEIKEVVREKYGKIAESGVGGGCCGQPDVTCFSGDYTQIDGYVPEADLGLGCGIPTEIAQIKTGDTVLDLGSGAGNDAFVARSLAGEAGRVIGVDMTRSMLDKATANALKLGYTNVEFREGDIENLPVETRSVDVVISNCVLNLVPDKNKAFSEIARVLKPGGHFSISDIVATRELPDAVRKSAQAYVGCVAGAMLRDDYLTLIEGSGFANVRVAKERPLGIPRELIEGLGKPEAASCCGDSNDLLASVTVYGEKRG